MFVFTKQKCEKFTWLSIGTKSRAKTNLIPYQQATLKANNLFDFGADFPLTPDS
jgi:hypothetical protein